MNLLTVLGSKDAAGGGVGGLFSIILIYAVVIGIFWFFEIGRASCRERV